MTNRMKRLKKRMLDKDKSAQKRFLALMRKKVEKKNRLKPKEVETQSSPQELLIENQW